MESNIIDNKNSSFEAIDLVKFILSFFVVAMHTLPLENFNNNIFKNTYNFVVTCAVPIFFLSSGYLLMNKIESSSTNGSDKTNSILISYLKKITHLYIIWTIVYLPITIYYYIIEHYSFKRAVLNFIQGFIFIGEHYNSWILWYLLATIFAIIFIIALNRLHIKLKTICLIGIIIFIISCLLGILIGYSGPVRYSLRLIKKLIAHTFVNPRIFSGFLYIPMGMLLKTKRLNSIVSSLLVLSGLCFGIIGEYTYDVISTLAIAVFSIGVFSLVIKASLNPSKKFFILRKISTVIYFVHLYIYSIFEFFIWNEKRYGFIPFIIVSLISLVIAFSYTQSKYNKRTAL